jgi:hypothetical protein
MITVPGVWARSVIGSEVEPALEKSIAYVVPDELYVPGATWMIEPVVGTVASALAIVFHGDVALPLFESEPRVPST